MGALELRNLLRRAGLTFEHIGQQRVHWVTGLHPVLGKPQAARERHGQRTCANSPEPIASARHRDQDQTEG